MAEIVPAEVFHASQIIADEATARGWSIWDFVERVGTLNPPMEVLAWQLFAATADAPDLVAGCNPGEHFAIDMERVFGIDAGIWERTEALRRAHPDRVSVLNAAALEWYELNEAAAAHREESDRG